MSVSLVLALILAAPAPKLPSSVLPPPPYAPLPPVVYSVAVQEATGRQILTLGQKPDYAVMLTNADGSCAGQFRYDGKQWQTVK